MLKRLITLRAFLNFFSVFECFLTNDIFYCNFDESTSLTTQCGGSEGLTGLGTVTSTILPNEIIIAGPTALVTSITDVKSISGPTINNNYCNIPFNYLNTDRYFCYSTTANVFKCEVGDKGSGVLEDCVRGNMLRVTTSGGNYIYTFQFKSPIQISEPGDYTLSFYSLFNCQKIGCNAVGDKLAVKIKTDFYADYDEVYSIGTENGRYNDAKWIKEEATIKITASEIYLSLEFSRKTALTSATGNIYIDEISIRKATYISSTLSPILTFLTFSTINFTYQYTVVSNNFKNGFDHTYSNNK